MKYSHGPLFIAARLLVVAATFVFGLPLSAQEPSVPTKLVDAAERVPVDEVLAEGLQLEQQRRWTDAVRHYESSLRTWEKEPRITQRLLIARLHFDIDRRYEDKSYLDSLSAIPTPQALDLYEEVLQSLDTYYVDPPNWSEVLRFGTASLEVALTEPQFLQTNLPSCPREKVEQFRLTVHKYVNGRPRGTKFDLRAAVAYVSSLAQDQLGLSGTATVLEYVCGAISTLDPYSRFLTRNQLDDTFSNIEGNFVGLGIELKATDAGLQIINVISGGPAEEAGLIPGDAITSVSGVSTAENDPDHVADLLRGPEHSLVAIDIVRRDGTAQSLQVARRRVDVPSVEQVKIVDTEKMTGYFRLTNFQKSTVRDVENALWTLQRQGMQQLIVDLRGNPGGLLSAAIDVADHFIDRGRIVITRGRYSSDNRDYFAHAPKTWNIPLIVLIDGDSASASEIFAGAIRDSNRGTLIGQRTFGKGSVQGIFCMQSAQVGLSLTTAKFFSPNNIAISNSGVVPHITIVPTYISARPTEHGTLATIEEDAILSAAIRQARGESRLSQLP